MHKNDHDRLVTFALIQNHITQATFNILQLEEFEKAVAEGRLGNCRATRTAIQLHTEAIRQLAASL